MRVFLTCPQCQKIGLIELWYMKDVSSTDRSFLKTFITGEYVNLILVQCGFCNEVFRACANNSECNRCRERIDCLIHRVVKAGVVPVETKFKKLMTRL